MHASSAVARRPRLPVGARARHRAAPRAVPLGVHRRGGRDPHARAGARRCGEHVGRRDGAAAHRPRRRGRRAVTVVNFHIDGDREQFDRVRRARAGERVDRRGRREPRGRRRADGFSPPLGGQHRPDPRARADAERRPVRVAAGAADGRRPACFRITRRWKWSSNDARRGTRAVPGARALRVPQRGLDRAARRGRRSRRPGHGSSATWPRAGAARRTSRSSSSCESASASGFAAVLGTDRGARRAHRLDDARLPDRRRRARARRATTRSSRPTRSTSASSAPLHASGARVVVTDADEDALLAAVTPRTRLIAVSHVLWTTGAQARPRAAARDPTARRSSSTAPSRRARSRSTSPAPTSTPSRRRSGSCGPDPSGALFVRDPERLRRGVAERVRARRVTRTTARSSRRTARGASTPAGSARPALAGSRGRAGRASGLALRARAAEAAARCRELLEPLVEVVTPPRALDARLVPSARRSDRARRGARRAGRDRPGAAGPQPRARLVRLVDERGRPAASRGRTSRVGRARPRSAAAPRRRCGCGRRARRRAPRRPCRRPRGGRRTRTTAA